MIWVKRVEEIDDRIGEFINREFTVFGKESEFVRMDKEPELSKYFFVKPI